MSAIDILCVALFIGIVALEGSRGVIPALIDLLCALLALVVARLGYVPLTEYVEPYSSAYLLIVCVVLGLSAILSIYVSRRLTVHVTAFEAGVGAVLGLFTSAVLTYLIFDWLTVAYGPGAVIVKDSVFSYYLYEFGGFKDMRDLLRILMGKV